MDLSNYRWRGKNPNEVELPEISAKSSVAAAVVVDENVVSQLMSMGFGRNACVRAAQASPSGGVEGASEWLFAHMEDTNLNDPLPVVAADAVSCLDEESISGLCAMGFERDRCEWALRETKGDAERAVDWLFSHADDLVPKKQDSSPSSSSSSSSSLIAIPAMDCGGYELVSFVNHDGKFASSGHYVATKKSDQEEWVRLNDDKVSVVPGAAAKGACERAYIYILKKKNNNK